MRPYGKSTALMLVLLLWFWHGFVFAEKTPPLKGGVLVLPLQAGKGLSDEQIALGFAVQNVIENILALHSDLREEVWFNWHVHKLFPKEQDLKSWLRGKNKPPPAAAGLGMRYLLTGQIIRQGGELRATLELSDHAKGDKLTRELALDLPGLERFRREFISLLAQAGIPVPEAQITKMLWHEELSPQAFALLGKGLLAYSAANVFERKDPAFDPKPFEEAVKLSPRSYLLLNGLGWVAYANKKYPDAISFFERALTLNPAGVDAADGLLNSGLETGDEALAKTWTEKKAKLQGLDSRLALADLWYRRGEKDYAKADYTRATTYFEKSLAISREGKYRVGEVNTLEKLAYSYVGLKQYDKGIHYIEQILPIQHDLKDRAGEATTLDKMGVAHYNLNQFVKAIDYLHQALAIKREVKDRAGEGATLNNLGAAYRTLSQYDKAIDYYSQALTISREVKDRSGEGVILKNLGLAYYYLSQYDKAVDYLQQALAIAREVKDRAGEGVVLNRLGNVFESLGQYDNAIDYYRQALTIKHEVMDRVGEGTALTNLGGIYYHLSQYDKAIDYYTQALTIAREGKNREAEGGVFNRLGNAYASLIQFDKAIKYYIQALAISREIKDRVEESSTLNNLGTAYTFLFQFDKAIDYYTQSLTIIREIKNHEWEGTTLDNLSFAWKAKHKPRLAIFYGKQAVNAYQEVRGHIQKLEKESQQSFLKSKESAYRQLAELLIGEGRLPEAQQVLGMLKEEEYFDFVRRDAQDADSLQTRSEFNPAEAEADRRYREIADRLTALGAEYSGLAAKVVRSPAEEQRLAQLEADLGIAGQAFEKFLDELETEFDSATAATNPVQNIRDAEALMEVLRELEPGTLAIYTLVSEDKYHAIVITPDVQLAHEYVIPGAELNRKVLAFREALQNPDSDPRPLAQELYRILVAPIENDLSGAKAKTLLWSLDGILRYLPIAALHDGQSYLAEGYRNVVFTPASLVNLKDRPNKTWKALGLGVSKAHEGFKALPSVVDELGGIIHVDGPGGTAGVLPGIVKLDQAFTQAAMLAALGMRNHPVVHIASHFRFRPGDYTASFLLLGDGSHLPLSQFKTLKNVFGGVDLLTLSACNTATGDAGANGKEVEGFGVLAQRKGAKAVVATLWEVADASTKELMQAFYRIRETGATKAEALQQAQLTLLHGEPQVAAPGGAGHDKHETVAGGEAPKNSAKAPYAHPYFWSPFILIGNSR